MKLSEHLFRDFQARLYGDGILLQQNNIGQAAVLIKVWRGWVAATGSLKMRLRGWNASAPSRAMGLATSPRGLEIVRAGVGAEESFSAGKSLMGPDQVS